MQTNKHTRANTSKKPEGSTSDGGETVALLMAVTVRRRGWLMRTQPRLSLFGVLLPLHGRCSYQPQKTASSLGAKEKEDAGTDREKDVGADNARDESWIDRLAVRACYTSKGNNTHSVDASAIMSLIFLFTLAVFFIFFASMCG